jgi:transcriptional regulator with XRE-family HTH domain
MENNLEKQISEAILASGLTLRELSRASGVDPGQLSRFMRGHRSMHLPAASKVCQALGLELVQRKKPQTATADQSRKRK